MSKESEVLEQLKNVIDPDLGKDIVTLGFIKNLNISEGDVSLTLELTTPACPVRDQFKNKCRDLLTQLPWVKKVNISMSSRSQPSPGRAQAAGLANVANIIAVSSCKGGVGKSTVAVNLAYTLSKKGARTGLLDADVYGPSLPTLVRVHDASLFMRANLIQPIVHEGVKLMSFGYVAAAQGGGAAIMRGPMASQVVSQLSTGTDWGELDYLVIDLPPGTGDIHLTLSQVIPLTCAIIVTTPQDLSFVDVVKGIQMFDKLKVPAIAVVENMAYFICDKCNTKHYVFGQGARAKLVNQFGFQNAFDFPIHADVSRFGDAGTPIVLAQPDGAIAKIYNELTDAVVRETSRVKFGTAEKPSVSFVPGKGVIIQSGSNKDRIIQPAELRLTCRCASCVDEFTGEQRLKREDVKKDIQPLGIEPMGNYAVSVMWNDGHSSIYPYDMLVQK